MELVNTSMIHMAKNSRAVPSINFVNRGASPGAAENRLKQRWWRWGCHHCGHRGHSFDDGAPKVFVRKNCLGKVLPTKINNALICLFIRPFNVVISTMNHSVILHINFPLRVPLCRGVVPFKLSSTAYCLVVDFFGKSLVTGMEWYIACTISHTFVNTWVGK